MKVLPGMQSAFVDIGLERDSFLYVSDFFDEDLEEDEVEKAEAPRPQKIERQQRPPIIRPSKMVEPESVAEADAEEEIDLQVAALRHIEEISEEPVIEPAPDDEILEDSETIAEASEKPEGRGARQRRQKRLRYAEPTEEETTVAATADQAEEESAKPDADNEDESYGGRRRRRGRGRGRGKNEDVAETSETEEAAPPIKLRLREVEGQVLVHHEPFERIVDDEDETAGDMLRDAMIQERIAGWIHEEERRTSIIDVAPTPEIHVGGLQNSFAKSSDFERISDGEDLYELPVASPAADQRIEDSSETEFATHNALADAAPEVEAGEAAETPVADTEPIHHAAAEPLIRWEIEPVAWPEAIATEPASVQEPATPTASVEPAKTAIVEMESDVEVLSLNPPSVEFGEAENESQAENTDATEEDAGELKDASAKVRGRSRKGEMATRRGGRGRRRSYRQRTTTDATVDTEERDDHEADADEEPAPLAPLLPTRANDKGAERYQRPVISDLLREGQEIIVQIAKEPIGQKGARITSHVALPGRYIVYMPTVEHIGVSRKIGTDEERQRLRRTLHQMRAEAGAPGGFIVRTAASGCTTEELREDMNYLIRTWTDIRRRSERVKSPAIVHRDLDLVQRILRDQLSQDYTAIRVDNELEYERIVDFVNRFAPKLVNRVKLYTKETPILEAYGVQPEVDKAVKPRVWLKSGGYIVINQTEALVAIDVNTGKFVGKSNRLEDTIVKTNLEAAKEIVRQIRLRDLGGIIVLDFIDMEERRNRQKVMQALEQEIRSDRSPSKILQFNDFGLVAVTRKRVKQSLERTLCTPCHYCSGGGMIKSSQTVCYEILAEARRIAKDIDDTNEIILRVNPEVAKALRGVERDVLAEIEAYLGGIVSIKSDPTVHQEQFDIALA
ncbi:MAG: Rne/Rng family ribonuclease [Acidobacteria bacterium]|nr:Rne/Rng family ribonuclease [Acidobacteriota bacterium]